MAPCPWLELLVLKKKIVKVITPECFFPSPKVNSCVINLLPKNSGLNTSKKAISSADAVELNTLGSTFLMHFDRTGATYSEPVTPSPIDDEIKCIFGRSETETFSKASLFSSMKAIRNQALP